VTRWSQKAVECEKKSENIAVKSKNERKSLFIEGRERQELRKFS